MGQFNVNFLGGVGNPRFPIPYNPDRFHRPSNFRELTNAPPRFYNNRPIQLTPEQMFKMYWTVKSLEITISAFTFSIRDPVSDFIMGGGTSAGIIGASAGLTNVLMQQANDYGGLSVQGHTKIIGKYEKKIRLGREGVFNGITMPDSYKGEGSALDMDDDIQPNILFSRNFKPNEGSICSAGPIHYFSSREQGTSGGSFFLVIDFSDILYSKRFYWPAVYMIANLTGGASFSYGTMPNIDFTNLGVTLAPSFGGTAIGNITGDLGFLSGFSTNLRFTQTLIVGGSIKIGKRCCDRFFWDGQDSIREDGTSAPPDVDTNKKECKLVCNNDKKEGVFINTPWPQQSAAKKKS
jgi:hypothetical protein